MNANDPPAIEAIPPQTATEGVLFQYQCSASDPDLKWGLDNLTFSDDTELFIIDPQTGAIVFTPTSAQSGIKRVTITVKDEKGASASASFDLTVVHVNHAPYDAQIKYPVDGAKLKEGDAMWLDGTAKDSDKGDTLQYSWLDNGDLAGTGRNISVKLAPGTHTIELEVSDGTETVSTEITVQVEKKETVTVASGGNDLTMMAAAAAAIIAIVAIVAALAVRRSRKKNGHEASEEASGSLDPEASEEARVSDEGMDLPSLPPPEPALGPGDEANAIIDTTVERLSDHQEAHPEEALDVSEATENLDIARQYLKTGESAKALKFARRAKEAADIMIGPPLPKKVVVKKKTVNR